MDEIIDIFIKGYIRYLVSNDKTPLILNKKGETKITTMKDWTNEKKKCTIGPYHPENKPNQKRTNYDRIYSQ